MLALDEVHAKCVGDWHICLLHSSPVMHELSDKFFSSSRQGGKRLARLGTKGAEHLAGNRHSPTLA